MKSRTRTFRPCLEILEDRTVPTAGSLDPSFGVLGLVTRGDETRVAESPNTARAVQVDGKIVVAGESQKFGATENRADSEAPPDFAVARYNLDGTLDTSFGGKGWVAVDFGSSQDVATAVVVQPDGRIVVAGYSNVNATDPSRNFGYEFALLRLNSDGSLDTSFDGDGKQTIDFGIGEDMAQALVLRPDGKLLVSGNRFIANLGYGFEVAQLNPDGSLDQSFNGSGIQFVDFGTPYDYNSDLALQPDGKIVLVGTLDSIWLSTDPHGYDFAVARLNTDGTLDTSFDDDGRQSIDLESDFDFGTAVAVQPDGKIVVSGNSFQAGGYDFAVARLNADGSLDTSFDGDGRQTVDFGGTPVLDEFNFLDEDARDMVLQPDGKIVVAGSVLREEPIGYDFAVARLNVDGSLDNSFDGDGRQTIGTPKTEVVRGVALQADGKIVVAGSMKGPDDSDFALTRLNPDGSPDVAFGEGGLLFTDFPRRPQPIVLTSVAVQADGKVVAASGEEVIRYNNDGTIDTTFGTGGIVAGLSFEKVEVQQDGKIVLAGDTSVTRLNADGSLDMTFGDGGTQTIDFSVVALALAPNGKIAVVGHYSEIRDTPDGNVEVVHSGFQVIRLDRDGSLDTAFDGDGKQTIDFAPAFCFPTAMAVAENGEIAIAGLQLSSSPDVEDTYAVARLKKDGRLDGTFGVDGRQLINLEGRIAGQHNNDSFDTVRAIAGLAFQPDGKLVVAGTSTDLSGPDTTGDDFTVFRLNRDGEFDKSFGSDGLVTIGFTTPFGTPVLVEAASGIALQPDGKIVVVGTAWVGDTEDFAVIRLTKDGRLDTSFDYDGKQIIDFGLDRDIASDVALQRDGTIVVVGKTGFREGTTQFALARLAGNGSKNSPTISINDVEELEGDSGTTPFTFSVRLSHPSTETVTVKYRTVRGSAENDRVESDYQAASGTLTFAPGETTRTVTVLVYGDRDGEANYNYTDEAFETFCVLLSQATNAAIADDCGIGAIVDDDIRISINDVTETEGPDGQTTLFTFTVTFSAAFAYPVTLSYTTADDSAQADEDYVALSGELTFAAGETSKTITIEVIGDDAPESNGTFDETFFVILLGEDSIYRSITKAIGLGTILNDD